MSDFKFDYIGLIGFDDPLRLKVPAAVAGWPRPFARAEELDAERQS